MGLYILASYKNANVFVRLALIALSISLYVGWYAYCTASWGRVFPMSDSSYFIGYGVWRIADNAFKNNDTSANTGNHAPLPMINSTDGWLLIWYGAYQAFATLGFLSLNLGYFLLVLLVYVVPCKNNADLAFWNAINNILGSVCWLVAVVLFGAEFDDTFDTFGFKEPVFHYSFYLAIVVCVLQMTVGILLLLPKKKIGSSQDL